jgi:hypothetical protein
MELEQESVLRVMTECKSFFHLLPAKLQDFWLYWQPCRVSQWNTSDFETGDIDFCMSWTKGGNQAKDETMIEDVIW